MRLLVNNADYWCRSKAVVMHDSPWASKDRHLRTRNQRECGSHLVQEKELSVSLNLAGLRQI